MCCPCPQDVRAPLSQRYSLPAALWERHGHGWRRADSAKSRVQQAALCVSECVQRAACGGLPVRAVRAQLYCTVRYHSPVT